MATLGQGVPSATAGIRQIWEVARSHWRAARGVLTVGMLVVVALIAYQRRSEISTAAGLLGHVRAGWLVVAIVAEIASMVAFARVQGWLLHAGGIDVPLVSMVEIVLAGNALSSSLPGGAAWSATWAFGQLRRRGADRVLAGWVLLVAGVLATSAVFVIVVAGTWVAGAHGPVSDLRWLAAVLAAIPLVAAVGYIVARRIRAARRGLGISITPLSARIPGVERAAVVWRQTADQLATVRPGPLGWAGAFGLALANWLYDGACLAGCVAALGFPVPWQSILVIYGLTQVSASLPVTPGGLGVVEGSLAALLIAYGEKPSSALAVVLLYRIVSFWALVPIGWVTWFGIELAHRGGLRRGPHPWAEHQHGPTPAALPPALGPERILRPAPCFGCPEPSDVDP